ncbi:hypothetical protein, partial [Mesorhizobium sp. M4B.F.Ca.ET.017.02.2.1]
MAALNAPASPILFILSSGFPDDDSLVVSALQEISAHEISGNAEYGGVCCVSMMLHEISRCEISCRRAMPAKLQCHRRGCVVCLAGERPKGRTFDRCADACREHLSLCTGRNSCVLKQRRSSLIVAGVFRGDFDMPFLLAILGVLGAAAFWWYRMKAMNEAAREVADVVGRVQGNIRRKKLRKQAALSPLTAIDNPVVAAATLITAIVSEQGPILPQREAVIREVISGISDGQKKTDEAVVYAKWAAAQIDDTTIVIDKLAPFLRERLDPHEREDLLQMLNRVAKGGEQSLK